MNNVPDNDKFFENWMILERASKLSDVDFIGKM